MTPEVEDGGSCFGFEIQSALSFQYLRDGGGEGLHIMGPSGEAEDSAGDLLFEWQPRSRHPFHARLYKDANLYRFWVAGMGSFVIDPVGRGISLPDADDPIRREERLWGIPAGLCLLHRSDLPLHAAAVDVGGAAVVFGAPGRFGKSTLAAGFHLANHRVLSEDLSCLRLAPPVSVIPGPAMLRVRQDVMNRLTLPGARVVGGDHDRVSLALDEGRRGTCHPVPLRGVVFLRESTGNVALERVPLEAAIPDLWTLSLRLPTAEGRARCFQDLVELAKTIPVWNLLRPLRLEALQETVDLIVRDCVGHG